jgi:hypothetical protein
MSYVVQPKWFLHEITSSRSRSQPAPTPTPQALTPLMPHLRHETFFFDTVDEADEFRVAAAAIQLKYHPPVPPTRHVTYEDLQRFSRFIADEITKSQCVAPIKPIKKCVVRIECLPNTSWLMCAPPKLGDR